MLFEDFFLADEELVQHQMAAGAGAHATFSVTTNAPQMAAEAGADAFPQMPAPAAAATSPFNFLDFLNGNEDLQPQMDLLNADQDEDLGPQMEHPDPAPAADVGQQTNRRLRLSTSFFDPVPRRTGLLVLDTRNQGNGSSVATSAAGAGSGCSI